MAAIFRRAMAALRPPILHPPWGSRFPKMAATSHVHAAVACNLQGHAIDHDVQASSFRKYLFLGATASVLAWQTHSIFANPALCMTKEDTAPLVPQPEGSMSWDVQVPGASKPIGENLTFCKAHFWKLQDSALQRQHNKGGNYRIQCKRCGKGPVVWPTTRMKAHVAGMFTSN